VSVCGKRRRCQPEGQSESEEGALHRHCLSPHRQAFAGAPVFSTASEIEFGSGLVFS
jgi:hypothetical protein